MSYKYDKIVSTKQFAITKLEEKHIPKKLKILYKITHS